MTTRMQQAAGWALAMIPQGLIGRSISTKSPIQPANISTNSTCSSYPACLSVQSQPIQFVSRPAPMSKPTQPAPTFPTQDLTLGFFLHHSPSTRKNKAATVDHEEKITITIHHLLRVQSTNPTAPYSFSGHADRPDPSTQVITAGWLIATWPRSAMK